MSRDIDYISAEFRVNGKYDVRSLKLPEDKIALGAIESAKSKLAKTSPLSPEAIFESLDASTKSA